MKYFTINIAAFLFIAFTISGIAQTPAPSGTPPVREEDQVIRVDSRLVVIPVSVTNAQGEPVLGLTAKDFRVTEEGRPQQVDSLGTPDNVPLEIALLFDVSASTDAMFQFQQETAAKFLREVMRPIDRATIFTVGANPVLVNPRDTAEKAAIAVKSITPTKQFTAFYDSVAAAAEYLNLNAPSGTRRVVVVISDGEDTNSTRVARAIQDGYARVGSKIDTLDTKALYNLTVNARNEASIRERGRVLKTLQDADTVFYSVNPAGSSYQLNKMSVFGQDNMQNFAKETGGTAFLPKFLPIDLKDTRQSQMNMRRNTETLEAIFRQLANELRAQYLVQYYSDTEHPNNKYVKLRVTLANPGNLKVRAREGYFVKN